MSSKKPSKIAHEIHYQNCFVCSPYNTNGLKATVAFNEEAMEVQFNYKTTQQQQGMVGYVHGGISSSILDDAQGALCGHLGYTVMTDTLNVRYYKAIPIGIEIHIMAKIIKINKRRIFTNSFITSVDKQIIYVQSAASFYLISEKAAERLFPVTEIFINHKNRIKDTHEANKKRASQYHFGKEID